MRVGCGANSAGGRETARLIGTSANRRKDYRPNCGRSGIFEAQPCEVELTFTDAMHQLDAGNGVAAVLKRLKPHITFTRALMLRFSYSIKLFKYFDDRNVVSSDRNRSAFISRTAR
jgi:hypothetical protein